MQTIKDTYVPMRDGVSLAVDLFTPDVLTQHAAILIVTPYEKDSVFTGGLASDGRELPPMPVEIPLGTNPMLMSVKPLVEANFVVAIADARGTGFSEGVYDYYSLEGGPFDGYDLVEWLASQSWSSGKVGMTGASAAGVSCYVTALTHPPHLAAMATNMHPADFYFDMWHIGGVFRYENRISWGIGEQAHIGLLNPGDPEAPAYERKRAVYEDRFHQYGRRIAEGKSGANLDWLTEMYSHDTYDDFWKERSFIRRASELTIPIFHSGVWYDHFARATFSIHEAVDVKKRLFMSPGALATRTDLGDGGLTSMVIAWFNEFLNGEPVGVLETPEARIYLMGREEYIDEDVWPVPTTDYELFLRSGPGGGAPSHNDGMLSFVTPGEDDFDVLIHDPSVPVRSPRLPFDQGSFEQAALTFSSDSLNDDIEVIGTPRLLLYVESDQTDLDVCVRLCDVDENGRSRLLNTGVLKASHRESHETPTPLRPNEDFKLEVEIWPIANLFKKGHRVRIDISASDFPFFESNPIASRNKVFHDSAHPSRLVLPVPSR
jgi:uncharacterized protein